MIRFNAILISLNLDEVVLNEYEKSLRHQKNLNAVNFYTLGDRYHIWNAQPRSDPKHVTHARLSDWFLT